MDKLSSTTNTGGIVSGHLLAILITDAHVYQVLPTLTVTGNFATSALAEPVGFEDASHMDGIYQPGGSASNSLSILVAHNTKFLGTKTGGYGNNKFALFTSVHGHYSLEKAAQSLGLGSKAVISGPVDGDGCMIPAELLLKLVKGLREQRKTSLYVNATDGTKVLGSFDPFDEYD